MTKFYNQFTNIKQGEEYLSEIAIVNTHNTIIIEDVAYINYLQDNENKQGYFKLDDNIKKNCFIYRKTNEYTDNRIKNISIAKMNFCYINIIKDYNNPELEGETMIFKFGTKLAQLISNYVIDKIKSNNEKDNIFDNTISLNIERKQSFITFDNCFIINKKVLIEDYNLDISKEINYKKFDLLSMNRKDKLKKLYDL